MTADERRRMAVGSFAVALGLPPIAALQQRGRDPETAKFTLLLEDGRRVRIGTIAVLWSQTQLARVLAVTLGVVPPPIEQADWRKAIAALISNGVDVDEAHGETFEDSVREWASRYGARASTDRDGAARLGDPFRDDGALHLTASGLAKYVRREFSEQIKLADLRQALRDLGAEQITVRWDRHPGANTDRARARTSTSYYRIDLDGQDA